jgi:OHCU decarboxylase
VTLDELNSLSNTSAAEAFTACCGAHRWVSAMIARRPFSNVDALIDAANDTWRGMTESDWREAFDHHPRIGQRQSASPQDQRAAAWSSAEQSRAASDDADAKQQLVHMNAEYEARFGHIYVVCAAGRSSAELLEVARLRLRNDPATELHVAAEEQRKITELRLRKLISEAT